MSAEFIWQQDSISVNEPVTVENVISEVFTIRNTGDEAGTTLGFYLRLASSDGPFEFPSTESPGTNLVDIVRQGNLGYGLTITQGLFTTRFETGVGDSRTNKIPLIIGTGTNLDEIEINSIIEVTIDLTFEPSLGARNFYVDFVLE
jgi:hypothetical protein